MKGICFAAVLMMAFGGSALAQTSGGTTGGSTGGSTGGAASTPAATATPAASPKATAAPKTDDTTGGGGGEAASSGVKVEAKACKSVSNRDCADEGTSFDAGSGSVSCWTRVTGMDNGGEIHHVWFKGDENMGDVTLKVGGSPWRTYSKKTISADMKGDWRVEVRDSSGAVLETVKFTVQ